MTNTRLVLAAIVLMAFFAIGYLFGLDACSKTNRNTVFLPFFSTSAKNQSVLSKSATSVPVEGWNRTHLWSLRLADENHYRLARLIPCRKVSYTGGPKVDHIDSCDYSSNNEFSVENTLAAQKWLFEHQNPSNCSGKRFAIIENFAWSGFGSVAHQVVWAFGMAIADNRIAVYKNPGNWVSRSVA